MKNNFILTVFLLIASLGYSQCEYRLELINDGFSNNGWGGDSRVNIEVDGFLMVSNAKNFGVPGSVETRTFQAYDGAVIIAPYLGSQNNSNVEYRVVDSNGNILIFGNNFSTRPFTAASCTIPCNAPNSLTVTNVFEDSAELTWSTSATFPVFDVEWGVTGFTLGSGTQVNLPPNQYYYRLSNVLSPSNSYDYYVRSKCNGNTSWAGPFTFTTTIPCPSPQFIRASGTTSNSVTLDWQQTGSVSTWDIEYGPDLFVQGTGTIISGITSKPYTINGLDPDTRYDFFIRSDCGSGVKSDWNDLSFTTPFNCEVPTSLNASGITQNSANLDWQENGLSNSWDLEYGPANFIQGTGTAVNNITSKPYDLTGLDFDTEYDFYVRSDCNSGVNGSWSDQGSFRTLISCDSPSFFFGAGLTQSTALVSWQENGAATIWDLEYGPANFIQGTGTFLNDINTKPYTISSLAPNTEYDFYVRSHCANGIKSSWAGDVSFTTIAGTLVPDYQTDFTTFLPNGWGEASTGTPATGPSTLGSGDWNQSNTSARVNLYNTNTSDWLLTPAFDVSLGGYELIINTNATDYNPSSTFSGMGSDDEVQVVISTDDGTNWTPIYTWDDLNPLLFNANDITIDISAYTGTDVLFGIWASEGATDDSEDYYVYVNSFEIRTPQISNFIFDGTSWNTAPEGVISPLDNLIVMSGSVTLSSGIIANDVTIMSGATLTANSGNVIIGGFLTNNGLLAGTSEYVMTAATDQFIAGEGFIDKLTIDNVNGVFLNFGQNINKLLTVTNGTLVINDGLTFKSDANGTAMVAPLGVNGSILGNVTVERFIPASNRAFRFLGSSVIGQSVFDTWQESGDDTNGFGTHITGTVGTVGVVNSFSGLDQTLSGNNSLFKWNNASQNWTTVFNTRTESLNSNTLYRVFIRGNRSTDLSSSNGSVTDVTLRTLGVLSTGNQLFTGSSTAGNYLGVANPYQSKVNIFDATRINMSDNIYYWDPTLNAQGAYTTIDISTSGVGTNGNATRVLEPGQAVFMQETAGASSIMFSESNKVSGFNNVGILSTQMDTQFLRLKLYKTIDLQNGGNSIDGLIVKFNPNENLGFDNNDAIKLANLDENMAIIHNSGDLLAIEKRPAPSTNETITLDIERYRAINYSFTASVEAISGLKVYIKDNLVNTMTEVMQDGSNTIVDFTVDQQIAASIDRNRFQIIFETVTLGLNEQIAKTVNLYPNPVTTGQLNIQLTSMIKEDFSMSIYNSLGQEINVKRQDNVADNIIRIDGLEFFAKGLYFVKLINGDQEFTSQFAID